MSSTIPTFSVLVSFPNKAVPSLQMCLLIYYITMSKTHHQNNSNQLARGKMTKTP